MKPDMALSISRARRRTVSRCLGGIQLSSVAIMRGQSTMK
jgi:hypothetical protein